MVDYAKDVAVKSDAGAAHHANNLVDHAYSDHNDWKKAFGSSNSSPADSRHADKADKKDSYPLSNFELTHDLKSSKEIQDLLKQAEKLRPDSIGDNKPGNSLSAIDREGFDRPANGKDPKTDNLLGMFGKHEPSVEENLQKKIIDRLNPEQKKGYDQEKFALDQYEQEVRRRNSMMIYPPPELPPRPDTPVHDEVERKTKEAEVKIRDEVRKNMSPAERERFDADSARYQQEQDEYSKHPELMIYKVPPRAGEPIRDYWQKLRMGAEQY